MKTKKLSFQNIKGVLSRDEMKQIMAGSCSGACCVKTCNDQRSYNVVSCYESSVCTNHGGEDVCHCGV